ncbi:thyroid adenoma-associated protein homolog [Punica granatum]|uniref:Uncharacterized protein n=2 Tax=Punica granatum TaxID=22663 RepID=A0A218WM71_PUNGR|nr:thyroid adenoma-associated protein homolog [Punica granatum]OWM73957.1 hypothetical protein CDL15_Pgr022228 [Punica granatum]PKI45050.1 hypothetical protein CRG98_034551 [Punica granatum]
MSAKWRALQHRHRYTYSSVVFPDSYAEALGKCPDTKFYSELRELTRLNSTYSQVDHVKRVANSFSELLLNGGFSLDSDAVRLYLEIMFLENSQPLHRTLISALARARNFHSLIGDCFKALCEEYGSGDCSGCNKGRRFAVSRAALSIMGMPKLGFLIEVIDHCAVLVAWDAANGLNGVVSEENVSVRASTLVMEQCQEALSCLYYLVQKFPSRFIDSSSGTQNIIGAIFDVVLTILRMSSFSRDCFVAAGVSFCATLQVSLSPQELGSFIMDGMFSKATGFSSTNCERELGEVVLKVQYKGELLKDILDLSVLSRLCLIRGILTAVSRNVLNMPFYGYEKALSTILYDSILPELCNYCENPTDSHFNFHALTVMQICLQQIKTSMLANMTVGLEGYIPIGEEMGTRILRIIWNNLEDPLSQTVKQVHLIFDLFLDIQSNLHWSKCSDKLKSFLRKIASDLLHLGAHCKGRYVPLAFLTKRLGARTMLEMSPDLVFQTIQAYIDDDVCCAATSFFKCFIECLRDEYWKSDGIEGGYMLYRQHCLPPLLRGLASGVSKLRTNLNTYALPVLLEIDMESIFPMLSFVSVEPIEYENGIFHAELNGICMDLKLEQKVAALLSLLKVSRTLALIEGDIDCFENRYALICIKGIKAKVPVEWLALALTHVDESLRVDTAEFLFLNPKTSSLPSHLELTLMKEAIPLNMRSSSTAFQMKWGSLFRKFFFRVRTSLERQLKQRSWKPLIAGAKECPSSKIDEIVVRRADDLFRFMRWLSCFLFLSCYPSAPYKRKMMAMELIQIMIDVWPIVPPSTRENGDHQGSSISPYNEGITSPDSTFLLVGSVIDSWDRLRESSFSILLHFPTPLPGLSSEEMIEKLINWAKRLVCSPRVRESDAGALTLRLIFRKYVVELGWSINASVNVACQRGRSVHNPVVHYLQSLVDWLEVSVVEGEKDLSQTCQKSFVHGVLLTLRYTFEELDWNSKHGLLNISDMRLLLEKLLNLVLRVTSLALWVVSADAWFLPEDDDVEDMIGEESLVLDVSEQETVSGSINASEIGDSSRMGKNVRMSEQIVMVGCWLAMKEVSLLLGTIIRKVPLPSSTASDSLETGKFISDAVLDLKQLESMGHHFLEVLLKMKHNGAIDKTRAGFTALCNRLLCSDDPRLCKLPESWMDQLMDRTIAKGQVVDDLLRRSAGIPAAFIALFLSEPVGTPKKLLPRALRWLIDVANRTLRGSNPAKGPNGHSFSNVALDVDPAEKISKIRDEGVIPTVHAFNVLRTAFNDTNLAADTSGFAAEALISSIRAFSSPYWEVRNSACLAYTALVRRMIGFLNVHKRESARRALTGLEFFHRYPSLHSFLFNELKVATESLRDESSRNVESNLAKLVHPSLCPVLILLSRLKPSSLASEIGDELDPFHFMPFIRRCSTQSNMRIRILASRALTGLVSNEKLPVLLQNIGTELCQLDSSGRSRPISLNLVHGVVLQLGALLDTNLRNLGDSGKKDQILGDLIGVLMKCSWIGSPGGCMCPVLNASFLKALDHMLSISPTCRLGENFFTIRNLLLDLSAESLDIDCSFGTRQYDPTLSELREQSAASYFSCFLQASGELAYENPLNSSIAGTRNSASTGLEEKLVQCLSDSSYEVRLATLKWVFKFLQTEESNRDTNNLQEWANVYLHKTMMDQLAMETNHRCQYYILRIFFAWNSVQFKKERYGADFIGSMNYNNVLQLWDKFVCLYDCARHIKTQETIICCLGICMKNISELFTKSFGLGDSETQTKLYECISFFASLIKRHSGSSEPVNMRKATAEAMIASSLLEQAEIIGSSVRNYRIPYEDCSISEPMEVINTFAHQVLGMWFTCIRLLEDEDDIIRQKLAEDVQKCFSSVAGIVPTQVEKVIELSFDHLTSAFGHWIEYFEYLAHWVLEMANYEVSQGDLVRRVFDKEIDNHHEEKLLICQICCSHMQRISASNSWAAHFSDKNGIGEYLLNWRKKFCDRLVSFARDHIGREGIADWIGGVGNHKDAFLPLYGNMLGFYALSSCLLLTNGCNADLRLRLQSDAVELGNAVALFLRNPLILNLYSSMIRLHEDKVGGQTDLSTVPGIKARGPGWDGFDPYFLLK